MGAAFSSVDAELGKSLIHRLCQSVLHLRALGFLVDDDVVTHEADKASSVLPRVHGRDSLTLAKDALLEQVLQLLVHVEILQVVDDADVVDVAPTDAEELVAAALEIVSNLLKALFDTGIPRHHQAVIVKGSLRVVGDVRGDTAMEVLAELEVLGILLNAQE